MGNSTSRLLFDVPARSRASEGSNLAYSLSSYLSGILKSDRCLQEARTRFWWSYLSFLSYDNSKKVGELA